MDRENNLVGEVETNEAANNMINIAEGREFPIRTWHGKGIRTFTSNFLKTLLGHKEYENFRIQGIKEM